MNFDQEHPEFVEASKMIMERFPEIFRACYPRRIIPPPGYCNPKHYAVELAALSMTPGVTFSRQDGKLRVTGAVGGMHICTHRLLEQKCPTYFLDPEFLRAVAASDISEDITFSEIRWPAEALTFVLPLDVSREIFGCTVPFMSAARVPEGYIANLASQTIQSSYERFSHHFVVIQKGQHGQDFGGLWPMTGKIGELASNLSWDDSQYPTQMSEEEGKVLDRKGIKLVVSLLLAMTAEPELVEHGVEVRKAKPNPRPHKALDALWSPNIIGRKYASAHPESQPGERSSPRTHLRRGHFRRQAYGSPGARTYKAKWIKPMWINLL